MIIKINGRNPITEEHKYKITIDKILEFTNMSGVILKDITLQDFFSYCSSKVDELSQSGKTRKYNLGTVDEFELVEKYKKSNGKWGIIKELGREYNISRKAIYRIIKQSQR